MGGNYYAGSISPAAPGVVRGQSEVAFFKKKSSPTPHAPKKRSKEVNRRRPFLLLLSNGDNRVAAWLVLPLNPQTWELWLCAPRNRHGQATTQTHPHIRALIIPAARRHRLPQRSRRRRCHHRLVAAPSCAAVITVLWHHALRPTRAGHTGAAAVATAAVGTATAVAAMAVGTSFRMRRYRGYRF